MSIAATSPPPRKNPDPEKFEVNRMGDFYALICRETFLPAYKDAAEHAAIQAKYFPSQQTEKSWRCVWCGCWHFTGYIPRNTNKGKGAKGKITDEQ